MQVTFTGAPIEEKSKEADVVEVMYVATTKEDEAQAKVTADDVVAVEAAAEPVEVFGEESVEAVTFEASISRHIRWYLHIKIVKKGQRLKLI